MADLITLDEVKERLNIDVTDTRYDDELEHVISSASAAVATFTERDFGTAEVTETRTFQYDGSGFLDIDDAAEVTAVSVRVFGYPDHEIPAEMWAPQPPRRDDSPVYTYLLLPKGVGVYGSPEMGFTRNLDVVASEGRLGTVPPVVDVTATWGWPIVPEDVKQALIWIIQEFRGKNSTSEHLQAEGIAGYNRAWSAHAVALALPNRARDLLVPYQRLN